MALNLHQPSRWQGPDGTLHLRGLLSSADNLWRSFSCTGNGGCGKILHFGIGPGIEPFGATTTIGFIESRMRCTACGNRRVQAQVSPDKGPP